ncbi:MAG: homoserine O-acetyltransferase MetX [Terriglobales bacterium]
MRVLQGTCISNRPFALDSGATLPSVNVRYAVYGDPEPDGSNVILVCHALSGSARVADWWGGLFGPDGVFDLERDCVIGINMLGSCYGSTGPASINPLTGAPYGPEFPLVSVRDVVRSQALVLDHLQLPRVRAVVGASIGGMQALQWAVDFPQRVEQCIAIGAAPLNAMALALNHLQRQALQLDPKWRDGRYGDTPPVDGLGLARAIAMCSYKSPELFAERYGRKPNRNGEDPYRSLQDRFDIGGYLDHQGEKFNARFDANSYCIISKLMDTFDLSRGYASEAEALARITASVLLVGITSDWLFPPADVRALGKRIQAAGARCCYTELQSSHGHDGFLADFHLLAPILRQRLARKFEPVHAERDSRGSFAASC